MRLALNFTFLTLVVPAILLAVPNTDQKPIDIHTKPNSSSADLGADLIGYRNNAKHTLAFGLGTMSGALIDEGESISSDFFSISQLNDNQDMSGQKYGVELLKNGQIGVHLDLRKTLAWGQWYEPFFQYGVGALYKTSESIGSLINYQRYQGRVHLGFEDLLRINRRLRLDIGLALSPIGLSYQYSLAYVIAD